MKVLELFAGTRSIGKALKDSVSRAIIPDELCIHIVKICEGYNNE